MPIAPWQETQLRAVIEFKKSNSGCVSRKIDLGGKTRDVVPPQLQGRIHPQAWRLFMEEIDALAGYHPYVTKQHAGQCCMNLLALPMILCIGFGFCQPDGGHYGVWTREVNDCLAHHQPTFSQGGCRLSLHEVHGSHFIQIDIDPNVAVGAPVAPPPDAKPKPYNPTKPQPGVAAPPPGPGAPQQQPWAQQLPPPGYAPGPPPGYPPQQPPTYGAPPPDAYGQPAQAPPAGYAPAAYGAPAPPGGYGQPPAQAAPPGGYGQAAPQAAPPGGYGQPYGAPPAAPAGYPGGQLPPPPEGYPSAPQYPPMK